MKAFTALASLSAVVPLAAAHGWVDWVGIDGKVYAGNSPFGGGAAVDSPIRLVQDNSPVQLGTDPENLPCGRGAKNAAQVVDAMPGSVYTVHWTTEGTVWPHFMGPIMTYMASCGSTTCDKFDATNAKWFKVDQQSYMPDGKTWWQMNFHNNKTVDTTLPADLAPGGYLIRHEIIALHNGESTNGAEFYPSCTQVKIGGSGSGAPNATVSFPGAYSENDKGILVNVYGMTDPYVFPGGPLSNLANPKQDPGAGLPSGGSGSDDDSAPAQTASAAGGAASSSVPAQASPTGGADDSDSSSAPSPTGAASQSTSTGRCRMKRRTTTPPSVAKRFVQHFTHSRRRHI